MESKKLTIYLAGPISNCNETQKTHWRDEMSEYLKRLGHKPIDPAKTGWMPDREPEDIEKSDIIVANLWRESIGTVFGIIRARSMGKPVILIDPNYIVRGSRNTVLSQIVGEEPADNLAEAKKQFDKLSQRLSEKLVVATKKDKEVDFDSRKLQASISNACRTAKVSDPTVFPVALAKRVEAALRANGRSTVATEEIRREVFNQLINLSGPTDKTYQDEFKKKAAEVLKAWEQYEKKKDDRRALDKLAVELDRTQEIENLKAENRTLRAKNTNLEQLLAQRDGAEQPRRIDAEAAALTELKMGNRAEIEERWKKDFDGMDFDPQPIQWVAGQYDRDRIAVEKKLQELHDRRIPTTVRGNRGKMSSGEDHLGFRLYGNVDARIYWISSNGRIRVTGISKSNEVHH